jgi:hypothetical protein
MTNEGTTDGPGRTVAYCTSLFPGRGPDQINLEFVSRLVPTSKQDMPQLDIARLWKRPDGTRCLVSKRDNRLYICVERDGKILKEQAVESPRDAMDIAKEWETLTES